MDKRPPKITKKPERNLLGKDDLNDYLDENRNAAPSEPHTELPIPIQIQLIILSIKSLENKKGSTIKDIRKLLTSIGVIDESTTLRMGFIEALKEGFIMRPEWAVKAGVYGIYVEGDGVPIFLGRVKPKPKNTKTSKPKPKEKASSKPKSKAGTSGKVTKTSRPSKPKSKSGKSGMVTKRPRKKSDITARTHNVTGEDGGDSSLISEQ